MNDVQLQYTERHLRDRKRASPHFMVIIFMGIFLLILSALTGFALEEAKYGNATVDREQALDSAEAGLEYYRWFLAHFPNNLTNGTGQAGPYLYGERSGDGAARRDCVDLYCR